MSGDTATAPPGDEPDAEPGAPPVSGTGERGAARSVLWTGRWTRNSVCPHRQGANSLVMHDASTTTGGFYTPANFAPDQGRRLAEYWHAAASG